MQPMQIQLCKAQFTDIAKNFMSVHAVIMSAHATISLCVCSDHPSTEISFLLDYKSSRRSLRANSLNHMPSVIVKSLKETFDKE